MPLFDLWNKSVAECAGKPVQFVFVTKKADASLKHWLSGHPVSGWLLHDPDVATARAFGMEREGFVFIDREHRVAGFDHGWTPNVFKVNAMLEGRRHGLQSAPFRQHRKPDVTPSTDVYVSPTRKPENHGGGAYLEDHWTKEEGARVKGIPRHDLYQVHESRMELAAPLNVSDARFDFVLVPPKHETPGAMRQLMKDGIERHFNIRVTRGLRPTDVYVMTAPNGIIGIDPSRWSGGGFFMSVFRILGRILRNDLWGRRVGCRAAKQLEDAQLPEAESVTNISSRS